MNVSQFFPASNWQKQQAMRGVEHENFGELPLVYLDNGESIWLRPLPPEFALEDENIPVLFLTRHVWRDIKAVCPAKTDRALLQIGDTKKLVECPGCKAGLPEKASAFIFGVTRTGTVLLHVEDRVLLEDLLELDVFSLEHGRWIEFYKRDWTIHMRAGKKEKIDRSEFEAGVALFNLSARRRQPPYGLLGQMGQAHAGWLKADKPEPRTGRVDILRRILPHETLVAPIWGMKSPHDMGWQNTSYRMMNEPDYLALLDKNNIGLLCGRDDEAVIKGDRPDLITVGLDADDQDFADVVLENNPQLENTFTAWGARAPKWFFHVPGEKKKLLETTKIYQRRGEKHVDVGSWLASGAQGVIDGLHPNGVFYRHNGKLLITLETLRLPRNVYLGTALKQYVTKRRRGHHWSEGRMLDLEKLENVHGAGQGKEARCPACAETDHDRAGDNLMIYADGRFKCAAMIDTTDHENHRHNQQIWRLAGTKEQA